MLSKSYRHLLPNLTFYFKLKIFPELIKFDNLEQMLIFLAHFSLIFASNLYAEDCQPTSIASQSFSSEILKFCPSSSIEFDQKLIRPWHANSILPCTGPFLASFHKSGRTLHFLAVDHLSGPIKINSPELNFIKRNIIRFRPMAGLIESAGKPNSPLSKGDLNQLSKSCIKSASFTCPESAYAATIFKIIGGKVYNGEPSPAEIFPFLLKRYSINDLYAFSSVRAFINMKRANISSDEWSKLLEAEVSKEISDKNGPWNFEGFKKWWKLNIGYDFNPLDISDKLLEPGISIPNKIQEIATLADQKRESILLNEAQELLKLNSSVMIIYGSSHYFKQYKAIEQAMGGPPNIICLKN